METVEHAHIAGLSRAVELAQETVSLDLLRDIDCTVDVLAVDSRFFDAATSKLNEVAEAIRHIQVVKGVFLDADESARDVFGRAGEILKSCIPHMVLKRRSIDLDENLSTGHREALHGAYEEWLFSAASMLEAFGHIQSSIISYNLDADVWENYPSFDNAEDLIADLRA